MEIWNFPPVDGWVYIMQDQVNPEYTYGGGTTRDPHIRKQEHSYRQLELFPEPIIVAAFYTNNVWQVEHIFHQLLIHNGYQRVGDHVFIVTKIEAFKLLNEAIEIAESIVNNKVA